MAGIAGHAGNSFYDSPWCLPSEPVHVLRLHSVEDCYGAGEPVTDAEPTMDLVFDVPGLDTIVTGYPDHPPGGAVELWTMTGGPHRPSFTRDYAPAIIDWLSSNRPKGCIVGCQAVGAEAD